MRSYQRIVVNTLAQQIRSVLNVFLSLYSTRLVLEALGQTDYGIYSVIGGVVAMLSFLTNALVITTQRYFSYYQGKDNRKELLKIFSNSIFIHGIIAILIVAVFFFLRPYILGMLIIPEGRQEAAVITYIAVVAMLVLTFMTAPFRALFIARENIIFISITDVLDGVLKLLIAIFLTHCDGDKLLIYVHLIPLVALFNLLVLSFYSALRYEECHWPRIKEIDKSYLNQLSNFAGWTLYSTFCILGRAQGLAVLINRMWGAAVNAAYGISMQVSSAVLFVAQSVGNATSPQIVKAEGALDRDRMLLLASKASKYATILLAIFSIPFLFEMPQVLELWLKEVPKHTVTFCRFLLAAALCDQLTMGLNIANQAIGHIRNYSLIINTIKLLTLPSSILCVWLGMPLVSTMWCYLCIELGCALLRIPYLKITAGLSITKFCRHVFLPLSIPLSVLILVGWVFVSFVPSFPGRFLCTGLAGLLLAAGVSWKFFLDKDEKMKVKEMTLSLQDKIRGRR